MADKKLSLILGAKDRMSSVLTGATKKSDVAFKKLTKSIKGVADGFDKVGKGSMLAGGAIIGSTLAGIGVMTKLSMATSSAGDRIDKLSQKIGMSRKAFQEYDYIMSQNGGDVELLTGGYRTLINQVAMVSQGNKGSIATFKELGVSIKNSSGQIKSQEQIFNESVRAIQKIENPTKKAILAQKLFGRAAAEMKPLLNQTADSVDNLRKKANEYGLIKTDAEIDACVKLTDTMDTVKRAFQGIGATLGMQLLPYMQEFSDKLIANLPQIKQTLLPVLTGVVKALGYMVTHFSGASLAIGGSLVAFGAVNIAIAKVLKGIVEFGTTVRKVKKIMGVFKFAKEVKAIRGLISVFRILGSAIAINPAGAIIAAYLIIRYWKPITQLFKGIFEGLKTSLAPVFDEIKTALKPLQPLFNKVGGWFSKILKPINTTGKASHNLGVKIGELIGGFIRIAGTLFLIFTPIGRLIGLTLLVVKNFDKIKNAVIGAGEKLQNFFSKFGGKSITANVTVKDKTSKVDGSHANGLDYVPFDGYRAELHKGERVLTAKENVRMKRFGQVAGMTIVFNPTINADKNTDTSEIERICRNECNRLIAQLKERERRRTLGAYC